MKTEAELFENALDTTSVNGKKLREYINENYISNSVLDEIRAEIEQLPTKTRTNWDGCCPDIDYPEIEYVDVTKNKLLSILDKYKAESEVNDADSN